MVDNLLAGYFQVLLYSENVTSASLELAGSYVSEIGKKSITEKKHIDVSVIEVYVEDSISLKQASIMLKRTLVRFNGKPRGFIRQRRIRE